MKTHNLSVLIITIVFIAGCSINSYAQKASDDLKVRVWDVDVPDEIWEDKPITAKCKYWIDLKGNNKEIPFLGPEIAIDIKLKLYHPENFKLKKSSDFKAGNTTCYPGRREGELFASKTIILKPENRRPPKRYEEGFVELVTVPHCDFHNLKYECEITSTKYSIDEENHENNKHTHNIPGFSSSEPSLVSDIPVTNINKPFRKIIKITPYTISIDLEGRYNTSNTSDRTWIFPINDTKIFEEKWNFKLRKRIRNVGQQFETIQTYSGLIKQDTEKNIHTFNTKIDKQTLNKMGNGEYQLISWLSQENTPYGSNKGRTTTFDFTVVREGPNKLSDDLELEKSDNVNKIAIPRESVIPKDKQSFPADKSQDIKIFMPKSTLRTTAMHGTNLFGMDYRHIKTGIWEDCPKACSSDDKCKSWTWVKPGIKGPEGFCFLKNGVPEKSQNECCISGIK